MVPVDGAGEDDVMLAAAEGGAEDVEVDGSSFQVTSAPDDLAAVRTALDEAGIAYQSAELTMLPKTTVAIDDEATAKKLLRLMDALEENDDVQAVYANFDIPEGILEAVAA
jgi:transcriptional/translational regulatory protein YebC/TACO1